MIAQCQAGDWLLNAFTAAGGSPVARCVQVARQRISGAPPAFKSPSPPDAVYSAASLTLSSAALLLCRSAPLGSPSAQSQSRYRHANNSAALVHCALGCVRLQQLHLLHLRVDDLEA